MTVPEIVLSPAEDCEAPNHTNEQNGHRPLKACINGSHDIQNHGRFTDSRTKKSVEGVTNYGDECAADCIGVAYRTKPYGSFSSGFCTNTSATTLTSSISVHSLDRRQTSELCLPNKVFEMIVFINQSYIVISGATNNVVNFKTTVRDSRLLFDQACAYVS